MAGVQRQHLITKDTVGVVTIKTAESKHSNHNSLTRTDLWHQLVCRRVSRKEIHGQSTKFSFDLYKEKNSRANELNSNLNHQTVRAPLNQFSDLHQFTDPVRLE